MNSDKPVAILIVDDLPANLDALEAVLDAERYHLVRAASGEQALREVLAHDFAAILMDVMMPGMDGFETARLIRQRRRSSHVPIIFLTAAAEDDRLKTRGYEAGAVDFLVKPVDDYELRSKLAVFADLHRTKDALREEKAKAEERAEAELAESKANYRLLADNAADFIQLIAPDGRYLYDSPSVVRLLGEHYQSGRRLADGVTLIHPEDRARAREVFAEVVRTGAERRLDYRWLLPSGEVIWVESLARAIYDEQGAVQSVLAVSRDITERKAADAALRALAERLGRATEVGLIVVWEYDFATGIMSTSGHEEGTGAPRAVLHGEGLEAFFQRVHAEDRASVRETFFPPIAGSVDLLPGVHMVSLEYRLLFADGAVRHVEGRGRLEADTDGKPLRVTGTEIDITERKRMEEQLREMQKLEAIGQLTGGLAHDFNNLLGVVVGNLDDLGERLPPEEGLRRPHRTALEAALRGAEVTRSLLAVARRQPLKVGSQDLNALVAELLPLVRASVGTAVAVRATLWERELPVRVDASGLSNAVLNLAINARDAMQDQPGEKRLELRTRQVRIAPGEDPKLLAGEYGLVEVEDNGPGMSEEVKERAFEPFYTTKERGPTRGTGLGLPMVLGFAEQLGGTARIESAPGAGTTVRLYLPLGPRRGAAAAA